MVRGGRRVQRVCLSVGEVSLGGRQVCFCLHVRVGRGIFSQPLWPELEVGTVDWR